MRKAVFNRVTAIAITAWLVAMFGTGSAQEWVKLREEGANFYDIQRSFNKAMEGKALQKGALKKEDGFEDENEVPGYTQFKRWEYWMEPRVYPSGNLPEPDQVVRAYQEYLQRHGALMKSAAAMAIPAANWTSLGPTSWVLTPGSVAPGLGRVSAITFHPTDPNTIFLGTPAGGLWKTTNGGSTWSTNTDNLTVLGVSSIVFDPNNANIMYMATGDNDGTHTNSVGVLKSTDGGATWNPTGLNWQVTQSRRITKLIMHPTNSSILLAASTSSVWKTTNAGVSWSLKLTVGGFYKSVKDIEFKPGDPATVYAATSTEFYRSTDTGENWTQITNGVPAAATAKGINIGVSANNANYVYLFVGSSATSGFLGLYRSTDSGLSFTTRSTTPNIMGYDCGLITSPFTPCNPSQTKADDGGQSWYDLALGISPTNAEEIYTGGVNIWKSTDGGVTWTRKTHWIYGTNPAAYVHADVHLIEFNGSNVYTGTDGGFYKSTDGGTNWTDLSAGMNTTQYYRIGGDPNNANLVYGGAQDNTITRYSGSGIWESFTSGDGAECLVDRTNSNIVYVAHQSGSLKRSSNAGVSFSSIKPTFPKVGNPPVDSETGAWVTPYVMDPVTNTTLYAGYVNVWKTTNSGTSWTKLSSFANTTTIVDLQVAPSNANYIYVTKTANVHRSSDGGVNWTDITAGLPAAAYQQIAVASNNPQKIWLTLSGYLAGNKVYASTDGGTTWSNYSVTLPNLPFNTIVYHNNGGNDALYAGADIGVYYRDNTLSDWQLYQTGLPNVPIKELEVHANSGKLRAATFGRGLWETDLVPPPGAALAFDGVNDYTTASSFSWPTGGPVTVEFWNYVASSDVGNGSAFTIGNLDVPNRAQVHAPEGSMLHWDYGDHTGNGRVSVSYGAPYLDKWTHVALVSEGNGGSFKGIYLDGVLVASGTISDGPDVPLSGLWTGAWPLVGYYHKGKIDEFRVWNVVRSQTDIQAKMNCELTGTEANLAVYYKFNHGLAGANNAGETTLDDISTSNNDGTLNNFALTGTTSNWVAPGGVVSGTACTMAVLAVNAGNDIPHSGGATKLNGFASGGNGGYTYAWAVESGQNVGSEQFSNAASPNTIFKPTAKGNYVLRLTAKDGMNATASDNVAITVNALFSASINGDDPVFPGSTHTYTVTTDASSPSYLWTVTNGTIVGDNDQPSVDVEAGGPQNPVLVEVYVTDGVTSDVVYAVKSVSVTNPNALSANAGADRSIPFGASTTLGGSPTAVGGVPPLTYEWSPTTGLSDPNSANPIAQPITSTTYTLTITDGFNTIATDQVTVTVITITDAYGELLNFIAALNIDSGLKNALSSKVKNSRKNYLNGNTIQAINLLNDFINQVNAQRGKALTEAQADELIGQAQAIIEAINAGSVQMLKDQGAMIPDAYALEQNYPNPFNPETEISFALPEAGQVTLKIFSITGQEIRTLANGSFQAGYQTLRWDGRDHSGNAVAGGVYFYQITATGANGEVKFTQTRKMAFVK